MSQEVKAQKDKINYSFMLDIRKLLVKLLGDEDVFKQHQTERVASAISSGLGDFAEKKIKNSLFPSSDDEYEDYLALAIEEVQKDSTMVKARSGLGDDEYVKTIRDNPAYEIMVSFIKIKDAVYNAALEANYSKLLTGLVEFGKFLAGKATVAETEYALQIAKIINEFMRENVEFALALRTRLKERFGRDVEDRELDELLLGVFGETGAEQEGPGAEVRALRPRRKKE